jgi:cysteine desulfurase
MEFPIYLDYHATTPVDPVVLETMLPYFSTQFGNPNAGNYSFGRNASAAVQMARAQIATLLHCDPEEIVFTSGATESINLAIKGVAERYLSKGKHIITALTEHQAVLDVCDYLEQRGWEITRLPVNGAGEIDLEVLENSIRKDTVLIALMYANNETGVVHPVSTIGLLAKKFGVLFFSDATQAIGKIPVNVVTDHIDILSFSAHKCYGPKGIGALYVRRKNPRVSLLPQLHGGKQENGLRSGTLNVPGIVGLGKAAEMAFHQLSFNYAYTNGLRNHLEQQLQMIPEVYVNGSLTSRLPTVSNLCFRFTQGQLLLIAINKQLAVSSGAACSTANADPSHVLMAMGLGKAAAKASIRLSLGKYTTREEIDFSIQCITDAVLELRRYVAIDVSKEKETTDWFHPFNRNS